MGILGCLTKELHAGRAAEHGLEVGKLGKLVEVGMHEGQILDVGEVAGLGPDADVECGQLRPKLVAPGLAGSNMLVQPENEQRHATSY